MKEKNTKGSSETDQGLNEDNPNTERTPIDPTRPEGLKGGTTQSNFEDEKEGTVRMAREINEENGERKGEGRV